MSVSCRGAASQIVDPARRKSNMICGVHGSPANNVTLPTWSKRRPAGAALACGTGFFTCAQPAIPASAVPAINKLTKSFFIIAQNRCRGACAKRLPSRNHLACLPFRRLTQPPLQRCVDSSLAMKSRQAAVPFIFVTVALDMVALGLIAPVLPKLILGFVNNDMTRTAIWNGIFLTVFAAMQFFFSPIIGVL